MSVESVVGRVVAWLQTESASQHPSDICKVGVVLGINNPSSTILVWPVLCNVL